jgi:methionyl-tRNA synthetase
METYLDNLQFSNALTELWKLISRTNKYIDETAPWTLAKNLDDAARLATVIYNLCESIRIISVLLEPFMPETAVLIRDQIGVDSRIAAGTMPGNGVA